VANRPEQLRLSPDERADLVAYVDGELADARSRVIATKLTMSATARREVEMLRKTWELLDHLPLPAVPEEFASNTVSLIHQADLAGHRWEPALSVWSARTAHGLVYLLIAAASLGVGYALARWAWPDPTRRLVRDLTLAEHLDEYLEVGTFDFLSQLAESREFASDPQ
jgi:anti-sigma factor RsiW